MSDAPAHRCTAGRGRYPREPHCGPGHGVRRRLVALALAALFLGGVGGASDLDALLFHGWGPRGATAAHYESTGTSHHADSCLLTFRIASGRSAPRLGFAVRFEAIPQHAAAPHRSAAPQRFLPGLHEESRAPPAALA